MVMPESETVYLGYQCCLDTARFDLVKDGIHISLSMVQYRTLLYLGCNLGALVPTQDLVVFVWGSDTPESRAELYVYVNRLRKKLADKGKHAEYLQSIRCRGYILHPRLAP
jgi:DNA-binding response OmpR family regulator